MDESVVDNYKANCGYYNYYISIYDFYIEIDFLSAPYGYCSNINLLKRMNGI